MNPSIETALRRDYRRPRFKQVDPTGILLIVGVVIVLWLLADILVARAQSVLVYSELREEAIWKACEDKLRSL